MPVELLKHFESKPVGIWPQHRAVFTLFDSLQTQWQAGAMGVIGFRYESIPIVMDFLDIDADERRGIFQDLMVMEGKALSIFREKSGKK